MDELGEPLMADGNWRSAVSAAGERLGALTALLELANRWQMPREREDLLWRILRDFPTRAGRRTGWKIFILPPATPPACINFT